MSTSNNSHVQRQGGDLLHWNKTLKKIDLSFPQFIPFHQRARLRMLVIVGVALACALLSGCSSASSNSKQQKAQAAGPHAVSVAVAPVVKQDVTVYLEDLRSVTAFNT